MQFLKALGANVILTSQEDGMYGSLTLAQELAAEKDAFIPGQFENSANPRIHFETTGPEIWRDTAGKVDIFVAAAFGSGILHPHRKWYHQYRLRLQSKFLFFFQC